MQYEVRVLSAENILSLRVVEARDAGDARRQIEAQGDHAAVVKPLSRALLDPTRLGRSGARRFSLILFSQELLALLKAGLSIVEALEALHEKEGNDNLRAVLGRLLDGLREGKRFSAVLADQPELFSALYVGIVRAAEGTSDLPRSLARFIDYQQRIESVRAKIVSSAIYPAILLLVGGVVSLFLIAYVVPRFAEIYQGSGRNLPWLSQLLLGWGRAVSQHGASLLALFVAGAVILAMALRQWQRRQGLSRLLVVLPGIGAQMRIHELARLYLTLGMLNEGGIPIVAAMAMVEGMVSAAMRSALQTARRMVEEGMPLSTAFETLQLTTPISLRLLRVGERTGEMGAMLSQSAAFYDGEISRWIDRFTRSFEPLLMAAIGGVVGVIVVALYMPIFDLAGSVS